MVQTFKAPPRIGSDDHLSAFFVLEFDHLVTAKIGYLDNFSAQLLTGSLDNFGMFWPE